MIDIHTHCLPRIDDGAKNAEESKIMLRDSFSQGIKTCVATPHCIIHTEDDIDEFIKKRQESYNLLMNEIRQDPANYPDVKLAAEVYLDNDISKYNDIKRLCIESSSYMLVEIPMHIPKRLLSEWIYNLRIKGIKPIIAHIDRYANWLEIINEVDNTNILYQINTSRFLSFGGRRFIKKFLRYKSQFLVGSDMHNTKTRKCNMGKAYKKAVHNHGEFAERLFDKLANKIFHGKENNIE